MNISQYTLLIFILLLLFGTTSFRYSRGARSFRRCFKFDYLGIMFPVLILTNFRTSTLLTRLGDLFYIYSGTFVARIIGSDYVFTCDAQNIHHIMNAEFESFVVGAERTHLFGSLSSQGILTLDGLAWRSVRGQLRRQFSQHKKMVDLNMHETHVERLLEKLRRSNGMPVDLSEPLSGFAQESHSEFVLGQPRSENGMRRRLNFIEALNYAAETIAIKGFCGPLHHAVRRGGFEHACTLIHRHVESITGSLRADRNHVGIKGPSYCFAQSLAADESSPITLRDQVLDVLLAGGDTLGTVLASTMWLLASNEYVYQKLREDVINHCGFQPPSYDDLKTIPYLRFVLYEVLRLYPPVPLDMRTARRETTLPRGGGPDGRSEIHVSQGQRVVFSSFSAHRSSDIFGSDAETFRPERWEWLKFNTPGYLPFHTGPRSCPGQLYALSVLSYALARISQSFARIDRVDEREWEEHIAFTLRKKEGVIVSMYTS